MNAVLLVVGSEARFLRRIDFRSLSVLVFTGRRDDNLAADVRRCCNSMIIMKEQTKSTSVKLMQYDTLPHLR